MQLLLTSPNLTAPTVETVQEYATRRFNKLVRFLPKFDDQTIRISVRRNRYQFEVVVELNIPAKLVITTKDNDLRKAIDDAYATARRRVVKKRDRVRRK